MYPDRVLPPLLRLALPAAAACAWTAWWRHHYRVEPSADELHWARTPDGWRLALWRWRPRGRPVRRHPVLLVHGLSAGRVGWDLDPSLSFARHLAGRGFEVWVLEHRGHGASDRPRPGTGRAWGFTADDYALVDVPAALDLIRERSGADAVHWVGHSQGGIVLYMHLASGGEGVRAGVTIGSALDYSGTESDFHQLLQLLDLARVLPAFPLGPLSTFGAPFMGRVPNRVEEFNVWPPNIDPELSRRLHATCFHPVSSGVLLQFATMFQEGGLRSADGRRAYLPGLAAARVPVLAISGSMDRQCTPAASARTVQALGGEKAARTFGKAHGQPEEYGHFDLVVGKRAPSETWPAIAEWLEARD